MRLLKNWASLAASATLLLSAWEAEGAGAMAQSNLLTTRSTPASSGPPEIQTADACAGRLSQISPKSKELDYLRKLFKKNLHFRGGGHNMIPHWDADYSDIKNVFASLTPTHIPAIVYLLREGDMNSGMRSIGAGVLKMFGLQALPCIEAALSQPGIKGYTTLSGTRTSIETDASNPLQ